MKSEERHQLMQNDLQIVTTKTVGFFERHLMTMVAVVFGIVVFVVAAAWWNQSSQAGSAAAWTMLDAADSLEEYGDVVDKYKGTPPGQWAQLQIAEKTLQSAMPLMFSNRDIAMTDLKRAREGFDALLQDKSVSKVIRERALWGLALTLETGCDGDTSKPIEAYERLLSEIPDSIFKAVALERIASLKKPSSREFYTWFSKEHPKPPEARPRDFKADGGSPHNFTFPGDDADDFTPRKPTDKKPATSEKEDASTEGAEKSNAETKDDDKKDGQDKDGGVKPEDKSDGDKSANPDKPGDDQKPNGKEPPSRTEKPSEKN